MSGTYSGGKPFGDIFVVDQSTTNRVADRLYREQQQRELQKRQDTKALEDEFGRNVAGIKSIDVPEVTQAYNRYKQAHINLQKKGNKATPEDQMQMMIEKSNAFSAIAASKEDKERLKQYGAALKSDTKGKFDQKAPTMIATWMNTPTSQRKPDEDDKGLKYQYAMPDISKEIANAAGKGEEFEISVGVDEKDPLKDKVEVYKRMNNPNVFYDNLFTGLGARSDNRNFSMSVMDSITDEEAEQLRTRYELKIQDPKFKAIYGEVKPFPASAGNTDLGKAVAIKTMQVVDNLQLTPIKEKSVPNRTAIMERQEEDRKETEQRRNAEWGRRNKITYQQSLNKIRENRAAGIPPESVGYVSDEVGEEVGEEVVVDLGGKKTDRRVIYVDKVDPERLDIITGRDLAKKKIGVKPIQIKQKDGTYKYGYYQDPGTGDWEGLDGQKISREAVKDRYIQSKAGTKFKAQAGTKGSENTKGKTSVKPKNNPLGLDFNND